MFAQRLHNMYELQILKKDRYHSTLPMRFNLFVCENKKQQNKFDEARKKCLCVGERVERPSDLNPTFKMIGNWMY